MLSQTFTELQIIFLIQSIISLYYFMHLFIILFYNLLPSFYNHLIKNHLIACALTTGSKQTKEAKQKREIVVYFQCYCYTYGTAPLGQLFPDLPI